MNNILQRLMMMQYNDQPMPQEMMRRKQQMLDERGSTVYRNVGPQDLAQFPDRNAIRPDDIMRLLIGGGENI
jgi:hypothetical protein